MTAKDKKLSQELRRRARQLVGYKHSINGYQSKSIVRDSGLVVDIDIEGTVSVSLDGEMLMVLRDDDYAPLERPKRYQAALNIIYPLLVLEDLASV